MGSVVDRNAMIEIDRSRVARSRFATGPGAAWKYLYDVRLPDGRNVVAGTDLLSIARRMAREAAKRWSVTHKGVRPGIVETWRVREAAPEPIPPCAGSMGCLCAGHARGAAASSPCDTRE